MKYFKITSRFLSIIALFIGIAFLVNTKSGFAEEWGPNSPREEIIYNECTFSWCEWRECAVGNSGAYCLEDTPCYDPDTSYPCIWEN